MKCEFCGYEGYDENKDYSKNYKTFPHNVKLYKHYKMHLCDRCVDKINSYHNGSDIDEYWEDEDAIKSGFIHFPRHKGIPEYVPECSEDLKYIYRKLSELYEIEKKYYYDPDVWDYEKYNAESSIGTVKRVIEKMEEKYAKRK